MLSISKALEHLADGRGWWSKSYGRGRKPRQVKDGGRGWGRTIRYEYGGCKQRGIACMNAGSADEEDPVAFGGPLCSPAVSCGTNRGTWGSAGSIECGHGSLAVDKVDHAWALHAISRPWKHFESSAEQAEKKLAGRTRLDPTSMTRRRRAQEGVLLGQQKSLSYEQPMARPACMTTNVDDWASMAKWRGGRCELASTEHPHTPPGLLVFPYFTVRQQLEPPVHQPWRGAAGPLRREKCHGLQTTCSGRRDFCLPTRLNGSGEGEDGKLSSVTGMRPFAVDTQRRAKRNFFRTELGRKTTRARRRKRW